MKTNSVENSVHLRPAETGDADAIAALHAESWRVAYRGMFRDEFLGGDVLTDRKAVWHERFANPKSNQRVIVAEDRNGICGFVCAYGNEDAEYGTFIDNLHVRIDLKRKGIGRRLMAEVARWSIEKYPRAGMYLEVLELNTPARHFYERLGANNVKSWLWEPPGGGEVVALRYAWPTPESLLTPMAGD
jgi:ribosomal protein S18 acetylase RimI-like enzyme